MTSMNLAWDNIIILLAGYLITLLLSGPLVKKVVFKIASMFKLSPKEKS